jgi:hypothetical protein
VRDVGVFVAQTVHRAREARGDADDLFVEAAGLLGRVDVLVPGVSDRRDLLGDQGGPVRDPAGRRRRDGELEPDEGLVEGPAALRGLLQRRRTRLLGHGATIVPGRDTAQSEFSTDA